ncbi:MAG: cytidine deaminase [bacterium]
MKTRFPLNDVKVDISLQELIYQANQAKERAIAPISGFRVGAALTTPQGRLYFGCNIENISLSLSICAERVAFLKALSDGEREFASLSLVSDAESMITPCGACRQLIWEFAPELTLIMANCHGEVKYAKIAELLPQAFTFQTLRERKKA